VAGARLVQKRSTKQSALPDAVQVEVFVPSAEPTRKITAAKPTAHTSPGQSGERKCMMPRSAQLGKLTWKMIEISRKITAMRTPPK